MGIGKVINPYLIAVSLSPKEINFYKKLEVIRTMISRRWLNDEFGILISFAWYRFAKKNKDGFYSKDADDRCSLIRCEIECEESRYLDLELIEIRQAIVRLVAAQGIGKEKGNDNDCLTKLYDLFVSKIEEKLNSKFKLLKCSLGVQELGNNKWYPFGAIGNPVGLIVRDKSILGNYRYEICKQEAVYGS